MINILQKKHLLVILSLIFLIGIFLRFYRLSEFPVGFHIDEAISAVNGYFISQTGKDSNNDRFPLQTEVFGDYNPTGYAYLTIFPIKLFGLNEFSTRFPGALLGALTILACFLLAYSLFKNKTVSLLSAFLVAISPWHINFSRSSEETLISLFFVVLGFALIFLSFANQKIKFIIFGTMLLIVSYFMYFTPRIFVPLIFLAILVLLFNFWHEQKNIKYKNYLLLSFAFLTILAFFLVFITEGGGDRFKQISVFNSLGTNLVKEEQIREDGVMHTNVKITQLFHNKITNNFSAYASNYLDYFSGNFLFIKGGLPIWFRTEGIGLVYLVELPFLLIGIVLLSVNKNKMYKLPLLWLLIAPLAAAMTIDDIPNVRRSLVMLPMIEIISAFGFLYILKKTSKLLRISVIFITAIFLIYNFVSFIHQYFAHMPIHKNWYRNEGFGEMVKTVKNSYGKADKIIITKDAGGIYPLILFYMQYDPKTYQLEGSPKDAPYKGFGKFFFVPQACPSTDKDDRFPKGRLIYVDNGTCLDSKILLDKKKTFIDRRDRTRAFRIVYD
ncbi:MAG: glycosyltransferase family 39 protein [Candidatus Levybacteria bacterium]|nr:glycosyltransferase family 39 protein [Candidatus Levybacteria bacterium]